MKRLLFILMCLTIIGQAQAQRSFPNLIGVQLRVGAVDGFNLKKGDKQGYCFGVSVNTYNNSGNQWVVGIEYLEKQHVYKDILIPVQQYTLDAGYYHTLLTEPSRTFYLTGGISAMGGYEQVNKGDKLLFDGATIENEDKIVGGCALTLELETFLSDRLILTLTARERALFGGSTGNFHFQCSAGIRIIIN